MLRPDEPGLCVAYIVVQNYPTARQNFIHVIDHEIDSCVNF